MTVIWSSYCPRHLSPCSVILCPQPRPRFILSLSRMFHVQLRFPLIILRVSGVPSCFPFSRHPLRILSESLAVPCYTAVVMANFFLTYFCGALFSCDALSATQEVVNNLSPKTNQKPPRHNDIRLTLFKHILSTRFSGSQSGRGLSSAYLIKTFLQRNQSE